MTGVVYSVMSASYYVHYVRVPAEFLLYMIDVPAPYKLDRQFAGITALEAANCSEDLFSLCLLIRIWRCSERT